MIPEEKRLFDGPSTVIFPFLNDLFSMTFPLNSRMLQRYETDLVQKLLPRAYNRLASGCDGKPIISQPAPLPAHSIRFFLNKDKSSICHPQPHLRPIFGQQLKRQYKEEPQSLVEIEFCSEYLLVMSFGILKTGSCKCFGIGFGLLCGRLILL